jgi:ABC-type amino acid transport substrate-binding protein
MTRNKAVFFAAVAVSFSTLFLSCIEKRAETRMPRLWSLTPVDAVRTLMEENREAARRDFVSSSQELREIFKRGRIVFGMSAVDNQPFYYTDENSGLLVGFDVEIGYEIANALGVKAVFDRSAQNFDEVVRKTAEGEVDVGLSKLSRTESRLRRARFTTPYISFRQALLINRLELIKLTADDNVRAFISQFTAPLAVIANSSYEHYAKAHFPHASVINSYLTWDDCVNAMLKGDVLAAYRDEGEVILAQRQRPDAKILTETFFLDYERDFIAIAVRKDAEVLELTLNMLLNRIIPDPISPAALINRYYSF